MLYSGGSECRSWKYYFSEFNFWCLCCGTRLSEAPCGVICALKPSWGMHHRQLSLLPADTVVIVH